METNELPTSNEPNRWTVHVDEDGVLTLPDEVWTLLGWKEGDVLEWIDQEDGSFLLVKREDAEIVEEEQS
jgi:bifunctional DNA-binding transcriptional regulator/antitoxin component of YhaV-PrlF toxin-antitoxin module